ncbi:MAG TPA: DUF4148 domain-containing protein [Ramlibacter sp.]|jgi:hypothetical protein|nr:DUF4148 domain-containing protein [Ramlibacter sp.]
MKRLILSSATAVALALSFGAASAQSIKFDVPTNIEPVQSGLTRAEVIADLHIWRLAGLHDLNRGEYTVDTGSYHYRKAYATYLHLRQSPQFAELVRELQSRPNANVVAQPVQAPTHAAK